MTRDELTQALQDNIIVVQKHSKKGYRVLYTGNARGIHIVYFKRIKKNADIKVMDIQSFCKKHNLKK